MDFVSAAESLSSLDRSAVWLDTVRCLHTRDKFNNCDCCFDLCPVDAIQEGTPPTLDESTCERCYACLVICPVGAFHARDAVRSLLLTARRLEVRSLEILCSQNGDTHRKASQAQASVQVRGCLAGLGRGAFLALYSMGVETQFLRGDACADCAWNTLTSQIDQQVSQAQQFLALWSENPVLRVNDDMDLVKRGEDEILWDADNPPLSRRGLFKMISQEGQEVFARVAIKANEDQPGRPAPDHLRSMHAAAMLGTPTTTDPTPLLTDQGLASIQVSAACTACGNCVQVCPTQALKLTTSSEEDSQTFTLAYTPQDCVACEACTHVCYPEAIHLDPCPPFEDIFGLPAPVQLHAGRLANCQKCGQSFAQKTNEGLCPLCAYRTENPLGSRIPPALRKLLQTDANPMVPFEDRHDH